MPGKITSDAGALLLTATDRAVGLIDRFAGCFTDSRSPELVEHTVATLSANASSALRWVMRTCSTMTICAMTQ
jgi:hypothetical protein